MFSEKEVDIFIWSYISAMLWTSHGTLPDGQEVESLEEFDLSDSARAVVESDCRAFLTAHYDKVMHAFDVSLGYTIESAGHDFWLTRAGHGTGFWDRGLGVVGQELSDAARSFGSACVYIVENGLVYID